MSACGDCIQSKEVTADFLKIPTDKRERTVAEIYDSIVATSASLKKLGAEMKFVALLNPLRQAKGEPPLKIFDDPLAPSILGETVFKLVYIGVVNYIKESEELGKTVIPKISTPRSPTELNLLKAFERRGQLCEQVLNDALNQLAQRVSCMTVHDWEKIKESHAKYGSPYTVFSDDFVRRCGVFLQFQNNSGKV